MSISIETLALAKKYADKVGTGFSNVSFNQTEKSIEFTLMDGTVKTFAVDNMITDGQIQDVVNSLIVINGMNEVTDDTIITIDSSGVEYEFVEKSDLNDITRSLYKLLEKIPFGDIDVTAEMDEFKTVCGIDE